MPLISGGQRPLQAALFYATEPPDVTPEKPKATPISQVLEVNEPDSVPQKISFHNVRIINRLDDVAPILKTL